MTPTPNDSAAAPGKAAPRPTPQQQKAIDTKHVSVVLSAGAGCGKTSVLTQRFLSHLAPGHDAAELSNLIAITFTEKAAREMRERIRGQCLDCLRHCPPELADYWLTIVRELDSARISTIHSFCASLLRANAVEAGIDPAFGLLDETLGGSFLHQSVEIGLHELLVANDADTAELVFEFGLGRTRELLASLVLQRYRIDFAKWGAITGEKLSDHWQKVWHAEFVPKLLRELLESKTANRTLELLGNHMPKHPVMRERCQVLLNQIPRLADGGDQIAVLTAIRENARVQGSGAKKDWDSEDVYIEVKEALTDLRALVDKVQSQLEFTPEHMLRGAEIGLCASRAAAKVGVRYDARKTEAGVLDFDDLVLGTRNLLRDHEDVCRRISMGIKLLMVDEFQDTDPIQDEIVRMLCGNDELTGRLFVVGDAKQSIYRFRRAEPKIFHKLGERVGKEGKLPLNENFRSQPEILSFVNAVCDGALEGEYEPLVSPTTEERQMAAVGTANRSESPRVEFLFATPQTDEAHGGESDDMGGDNTDNENAATRRRREGDWIASRITQLLSNGASVRDKKTKNIVHRPVEPKEIVILFRAMSDVRYYEEALREKGLAYYVVGGRAFFAQQEIFDVVNLCQYLDDVDDEVALIGVLRSPFFSLSDDSIVALGQSPTQALKHAPPPFLPEQQQVQVRRAGDILAELRDQKDRLPISKLLLLAVERTGYDASLLTEFLGERKLANLRKLIDMARKFDQSGLFTLADFVDRLCDAVADETHEPLAATHPESANVVRLMSIHQSKGLEFPVVFIADMDRKGRDQLSAAHFDPDLGPLIGLPEKFGVKRDHPGLRMSRKSESEQDLQESRRVLYVAMTRAADLLILSANLKKAGQAANPWLKLVAERFDLQTGQPRMEPTAEGVPALAKYSGKLPGIHVHQVKPEAVRAAPVTQADNADSDPIPLAKLREEIERSEPIALPDSLQIIPPDRAARRRFSVSEIETVDAQIRAGSGNAPVGHRPCEKSGERDTDELVFGDLSSAEQLGKLVHAVLERLDFGDPQEAEALLDKFSSFAASPIEPSARVAAATCIANLVGSSLGADLATARQIHREIDFLLNFSPSGRWGQGRAGEPRVAGGDDRKLKNANCKMQIDEGQPFVISGTIDCLFESADGTWTVLDYKTGLRDKSTPATELLADYEIQLGLYALAVREFLKRLPNRIELAFIRNGVDRVAFEPTESKLDEITARVERVLSDASNLHDHVSN